MAFLVDGKLPQAGVVFRWRRQKIVHGRLGQSGRAAAALLAGEVSVGRAGTVPRLAGDRRLAIRRLFAGSLLLILRPCRLPATVRTLRHRGE